MKAKSPRTNGGPAKSSSRQAPSAKNHSNTDEIDDRRRWESYWRRQLEFDLYEIASATAEVDNLDRRVPGPLSITFREARALAAIHGVFCACHPAPVRPPGQQQSKGAA